MTIKIISHTFKDSVNEINICEQIALGRPE